MRDQNLLIELFVRFTDRQNILRPFVMGRMSLDGYVMLERKVNNIILSIRIEFEDPVRPWKADGMTLVELLVNKALQLCRCSSFSQPQFFI